MYTSQLSCKAEALHGKGYAEKEAELFVDSARKAGLPACVPADKLKDMPNLWRVKSCDQQRAKIAGAG